MKGVIIAGGKGTRLSPFTDYYNKHLLPLYKSWLLENPLEKIIETGIRDILIITNRKYIEIMSNVFGDGRDFSYIKKIEPEVRLRYAEQEGDGTGGISHALSFAKEFADGEKLFVALGDNVTNYDFKKAANSYRKTKDGAKIFIREVPREKLQHFGVVELKGKKVIGIEEKPRLGKEKGKHMVTGYYLVDHTVFDKIKTLVPSPRGQLEVTDLMNMYLREGNLDADVLGTFWIDAGTPENLVIAQFFIASQMGVDFSEALNYLK